MTKNNHKNAIDTSAFLSNIPIFFTFLTVVSITGCQSMTTNEDYSVIQRSNHVYETTGYGDSKSAASQNAIKNATNRCKKLSPVVITDTMVYNGLVNEKIIRIADQAGTIASGIIGTKTPKLFRDDDYEFNIVFKCQ